MDWTYKTFTPAVIVQRYGWGKVLAHKLADAKEMARRAGVENLPDPRETVTTSWRVADDGSYVPQVADGNETYYGIVMTFEVDNVPGVVRH